MIAHGLQYAASGTQTDIADLIIYGSKCSVENQSQGNGPGPNIKSPPSCEIFPCLPMLSGCLTGPLYSSCQFRKGICRCDEAHYYA